MKKRLLFLIICIVLLLGALITRLVFIQIVDTEKYASVTAMQQRIRLDGINKRGTIYDRNNIPLTGDTQEYVYIIAKNKIDNKIEKLFKSINGRKVVNQNKRYEVYSSTTFDNEVAYNLRKNYEAFIIKAERRYAKDQPAVHIVGYINQVDEAGACGLEKDYNEYLTKKKKVVYASTDAKGNIIPGKGITTKEEKTDSGIITTLDVELQKKAEKIMEESNYNGAMVILDAKSGELLSSVSTPSYNPYEIEKYLESDNTEFINKATQSLYPPGSTFKIIVAAAALEKGIVTPETKFECKGYEEINGVRINCSSLKGHGILTFREAFAKSCNSVFIQLGMQLGGKEILDMAKKFGLSEKAVLSISGEKKGNLPSLSDCQGAGIGNLSIGQGKVLVTPVQIAKITDVIANGGIKKNILLVKGTTCDGKTEKVEDSVSERIISQKTAETIKELMAGVVDFGTARSLNVEYKNEDSGSKMGEKIRIAGKTGSAQANYNGEETVHGWFTGFLPVDDPKYVITVFVQDGGSGSGAAIPLFEKIAQSLYE
ncbi:peptidoglycan D,D-transpeptidase FtsI family protein [Anaerovorax odorimutans]|uniref:peptidoglycan D,D-transpeptidase FtsI family protein n=1 Tax=Anaerovorax odorimutans TaxID=109327 RepID=UPI0004105830|nr:penicillin-binding transpeptidase domain-containing protein [Anaerovorax odorimutans]